jgi:hypothetical protein
VGWFSFDGMGATAGDVIACEVVCDWLREAGRTVDVAGGTTAVPGDVRLDEVDASNYDQLVFVCGPLGNGPPITELLERFSHCHLLAVDVSMLDPLAEWNPFDLLIERDSSEAANPDLVFAGPAPLEALVGLALVHPQSEYRDRGRHGIANAAAEALLDGAQVARFDIDTRLDVGTNPLRSAAAIESAIARLDAMVTTRLHGAVLALKNGVGVVAIDPIAGGAKVSSQMRRLGWPCCFHVEELDPDALRRALDFALSDEGRSLAADVASRARKSIDELARQFVDAARGA